MFMSHEAKWNTCMKSLLSIYKSAKKKRYYVHLYL